MDFVFWAVTIWFLVWSISETRTFLRNQKAKRELRELERRIKERRKMPRTYWPVGSTYWIKSNDGITQWTLDPKHKQGAIGPLPLSSHHLALCLMDGCIGEKFTTTKEVNGKSIPYEFELVGVDPPPVEIPLLKDEWR